MLSSFFNIPINLMLPIAEAFDVILIALTNVIDMIFNNINRGSIGMLFLISLAISFIFVAIKFIRSVVWGA